jgi:hypothetical protein
MPTIPHKLHEMWFNKRSIIGNCMPIRVYTQMHAGHQQPLSALTARASSSVNVPFAFLFFFP